MHLPNFVRLASVKEDALCASRLQEDRVCIGKDGT